MESTRRRRHVLASLVPATPRRSDEQDTELGGLVIARTDFGLSSALRTAKSSRIVDAVDGPTSNQREEELRLLDHRLEDARRQWNQHQDGRFDAMIKAASSIDKQPGLASRPHTRPRPPPGHWQLDTVERLIRDVGETLGSIETTPGQLSKVHELYAEAAKALATTLAAMQPPPPPMDRSRNQHVH